MVRASVMTGGGHPHLHARIDALLWSINERLAARRGLDLPKLTSDYLSDVLEVARWQNSVTCERCGNFNPISATYCESCGEQLADSSDEYGDM